MPTPTNNIILPPRLFATVGYYAQIAAAASVVVDTSLRYDKRHKSVHRYDIADTRGRLSLTVPIVKPHECEGHPTWADVGISTHGEWWRLHLTALESAYGRTPYFEFIIDKFSDIFTNPEQADAATDILDLTCRADKIVRHILMINTPTEWRPIGPDDLQIYTRSNSFSSSEMITYYQIRANQLGFIHSLSVLDLIFNLGPEATLYIDEMARGLQTQTSF